MWHKLSADNLDPDFVERRRVGLENFLLRVASHPVLSNDKNFFLFLTEVSKQTQSFLMSLWSLLPKHLRAQFKYSVTWDFQTIIIPNAAVGLRKRNRKKKSSGIVGNLLYITMPCQYRLWNVFLLKLPPAIPQWLRNCSFLCRTLTLDSHSCLARVVCVCYHRLWMQWSNLVRCIDCDSVVKSWGI